MANKGSSYTINLDIKSSKASKMALDTMQKSLDDSNGSIDELNKTYLKLADNTKDLTDLNKQYNAVVDKQIKNRQNAIDLLEAEKIQLIANNDLSEEQLNIELQLKNAEIQKLAREQAIIKAKSKEAKLTATINKSQIKAVLSSEKMQKAYTKIVKLQDKFAKANKSILNVFKAIIKHTGKLSSTLFKLGSNGVKSGIDMFSKMSSLVSESSTRVNDKSKALKSLSNKADPSMLDELYVRTGSDYSTIVEAINQVANLVDKKDILKYAVAELENPGLGRLMAQQTTVDKLDYKSIFDQIRKSTGVQDTSSIIEATLKSDLVKRNAISQSDYAQAYALLSQKGIDEDSINKIIRNVAANKGSVSFADAFNSTDLSKYVNDARLKNTLKNNDLKMGAIDIMQGSIETPQETAAREAAEELRRFEIEKDKMLAQILPAVLPVMKGVMKLVQLIMPTTLKIMGYIAKGVGTLVNKVTDSKGNEIINIGSSMVTAATEMELAYLEQQRLEIAKEHEKALAEIRNNNKVIEQYDLERRARIDENRQMLLNSALISNIKEAFSNVFSPMGNQSTNNTYYNTSQTFNMSANQQTPLAFAGAVGNNKFVTRTSGAL